MLRPVTISENPYLSVQIPPSWEPTSTTTAVPALLGYTGDAASGVRKQVAWALGACQSDSLAPALADSSHRAVLRALTDPDAGVREGGLLLGTWQRLILMDFDGPRKRRVSVTLLRESP